MMNGVPQDIRTKLEQLYDEEGYEPDENGNVDPGVSDSLDALHLMFAIENEFDIEFPEDVDKTILLNINKVVECVEKEEKKYQASPEAGR